MIELPVAETICQVHMPKRFLLDGQPWRSMLPSGLHCETCHALVKVLDAELGLQLVSNEGPRIFYDIPKMRLLLEAHSVLNCRSNPFAIILGEQVTP